jgi:hypothetical protein
MIRVKTQSCLKHRCSMIEKPLVPLEIRPTPLSYVLPSNEFFTHYAPVLSGGISFFSTTQGIQLYIANKRMKLKTMKPARQLVSGNNFVLLLNDDGLWLAGQLSTNVIGKEYKKFKRMANIDHTHILSIACGPRHAILVTDVGIYGIGDNAQYQLGAKYDDMDIVRKSLLPVSIIRRVTDAGSHEAEWRQFTRIYDEAWYGNEIITACCSDGVTFLLDDAGSVYKSSDEMGFMRLQSIQLPGKPPAPSSWFFHCRVCGSVDNLSHEAHAPNIIFCNTRCQKQYHALAFGRSPLFIH